MPAGCEIGANPWVANRDKGVFGDDANVFWPERWLEDAEREREMEKYFFSWGYGTRGCLGKNDARMESYKAIV